MARVRTPSCWRHRLVAIALLAACSSSPSDSTTDATSTSDGASTSDAASISGAASTSDAASTSGAASTSSAELESGGDEEAMICQPSCVEAIDCCEASGIPPGMGCPTESPFELVCPDGVCRPGECGSDDQCPQGRVCVATNGVSLCRAPCEQDDDCMFVPSCSGIADDGTKYCGSVGTGCTTDDDCMGLGICVDEKCGCTSDADCPPDAGCTPSWNN